ncbi:pyrroloquinoline quinone biosynthesis peptide chaperone PqqD [Tanticharoenia sakaeratensis]
MTDSAAPAAASTGQMIEGSAIPRFTRGHRLQHDKVRNLWLVQAPEKAFVADPVAASVLQRIDGARSLDAIIDDLASTYDAPRPAIAADVQAMLSGLMAKKVIAI